MKTDALRLRPRASRLPWLALSLLSSVLLTRAAAAEYSDLWGRQDIHQAQLARRLSPTDREASARADALAEGFAHPPNDARLRAYWWWLNGNVTREAITRDLEEMKAKGFSGAVLLDADGASQDGNDRVPHGPTFFTPEWRELYKHTLREADRLDLEISLNILSGWNLGGPNVPAADAAKKLAWSETRITGPQSIAQALPEPKSRDGFYRDLFVVGYRRPLPPTRLTNYYTGLTVSSEQTDHPAKAATDGDSHTFWVSSSSEPGKGPTRQKPEWLQMNFSQPVSVERLLLQGRPGYGPRDGELQVSDDGKTFRTVQAFAASENGDALASFPAVSGRAFRVAIFSAFDPRSPLSPRNVQVAELKLSGRDGVWPGETSARRPIQKWQEKAMHKTLIPFSAPNSAPLFLDFPAEPGEEDTRAGDVVDLTSKRSPEGVLRWEAPEGEWEVLRFGCTIGDHSRVSTSSEGWQGFALDVLDAGALRRYWDAIVEPLIADAGPLAGKSLKYLHTDSWEVEAINWTPTLREEFRQRRGYDLLPFLPVLAGRIVDSRPVSNRFLHDFRKTLGDLAIDNHYRILRDNAHRHGLLTHPESGGPHAVPIDAQRCLGWNDAPMSEFWAWSWRHRVGDENRFFVKQPASAAHTYGRKLIMAEGFTTIGPHWQETIWDNLKPAFDQAACEGMNVLVWHAFVCSPTEMGLPGQQYFAGTHLNPNVTWWAKSKPFFDYINRCQWMVQQGRFVADVCYYYGDHVPNFAQLKRSDPAQILPGYDYDVITEEALLTRMSARDGRLILPDGMSYRVLVLPDRTMISLPVLRKLRELVAAGATVIGPKPVEAGSLQDFPQCDAEVAKLAEALWGPSQAVGKGRVISGKTAREVLLAEGVKPDFESSGGQPGASLDYLHRRDGETDIYFVASRSNLWETVRCSFRVTGKAPELWDAVSGERRFAVAYTEADGRIMLPLEFPPCGSRIVVFREPASAHPATAPSNAAKYEPLQELSGSWTVKFDPQWGGPESAQFDALVSWPQRPEPGIQHYSGTATYTKSFDLPDSAIRNPPSAIFLDLGQVRELAEVRVNGQSAGVVWTPPFRADITAAVKPGANRLEIEVVNFWPNRIIGDAALPPAERRTKTNIRKLTADTALMESGLLGPVRLLRITK